MPHSTATCRNLAEGAEAGRSAPEIVGIGTNLQAETRFGRISGNALTLGAAVYWTGT
jgi:hypothetical protein